MREARIIVVTGATGRQGGAVARHLVADGWRVRALVRNPNSPAARDLEARGIELVQGDLGDVQSLVRAFAGAHGVFAVTDFWKNGVHTERRHGANLVDGARIAAVQHFVFSSGSAVHRAQGVPQLESKWATEQLAWRSGVPTTVLRPNFFMELLTDRAFFPPFIWGMLRKVVGPHKRLGWIALDDIGAAAAAAFAQPEHYCGRTITLCGDRRSVDECAELFTRVAGKRPFMLPMPRWFVRRFVSFELMALWEWAARSPVDDTVSETRAQFGASSMEQWLYSSRRAPVTSAHGAATSSTRAA